MALAPVSQTTSKVSIRLRWALALSIPIVGVLELGLSAWTARRVPRDGDFSSAKPRLVELRREADGVVVAPRWIEPVARMALGDQVLPLRDVARADESTYGKVVEISANGARLPELSGFQVLKTEELGGGLAARLLANPAQARPTFDFTSAVEQGKADVAWSFPDRREPCPWKTGLSVVAPGLFGHPTMPSDRYPCGRAAWQSVGVTVHDDEHHDPRRCVWSHPPQGGDVSLVFRDVPLGKVVHGHLSLHWTLERDRPGTPIAFVVRVDGAEVGRDVHKDGEGWRAFSIPLGAKADTRAGEVELRIESANANERQACWEADSR